MEKNNDLTKMITQALDKLKMELGENLDPSKINLAELERRTGISRAKHRKIKKDGFIILPHASKGRTAKQTVLTGYTGGLTSVKTYISNHRHLVPAKRLIVSPQGNRGRRYQTSPGESYQMDWGFVNAETGNGDHYKLACFAMVCHCCGKQYMEHILVRLIIYKNLQWILEEYPAFYWEFSL